MRVAIVEGRFESYRTRFHETFVPPDEKTRRSQKRKWLAARGRPVGAAQSSD